MALTEEDIRKMSPEQLRDLQKQQCIFCHIISKRVQSRIIYEDDKVTAVLDINPANPGHVLLMPKEHYSVSPQIPDDLMAHLAMIAKQMSQAMLRALGAQGTTVIAANGVAAGQRASHFMMHIIPRRDGDKAGMALPPGEVTEHQVMELQRVLAPVVAKAFGKEAVVVERPDDAAKEAPEKDGPAKQEPQAAGQRPAPQQSAPAHPSPSGVPAPSPSPPSSPSPAKRAAPPDEDKDDQDKDGQDSDDKPEANLDDITSLLLGGKR